MPREKRKSCWGVLGALGSSPGSLKEGRAPDFRCIAPTGLRNQTKNLKVGLLEAEDTFPCLGITDSGSRQELSQGEH